MAPPSTKWHMGLARCAALVPDARVERAARPENKASEAAGRGAARPRAAEGLVLLALWLLRIAVALLLALPLLLLALWLFG
ncbi:hypothetical protein [Falsiroseomonas oryzae]|uniref:hypothetical protein n=1 Tax=Falsiroseomonas oryzae TaxID=2766473 RepID=UPI0022EAFF47|nr:hypothetical protein [Roseomonas sp. MO-31]